MFELKNRSFIDDAELEENYEMEEMDACEKEPAEGDWRKWEYADWERITDEHAENAAPEAPAGRQYTEMDIDRIYRKAHNRRKERTAITAARFMVMAAFTGGTAWVVHDVNWLCAALGVTAFVFAMLAAYGAGKCREM